MRSWRWLLAIKRNHLYFRILSYFLFLLVPTIIVGSVVYFVNLHMLQRQMADKVTSNLLSSSHVIDIYLRTIEQTGMNFLMNSIVQQHLLPVDQMTDRNKELSASITRMLASSRSIVDPYTNDLFVYADNQLVYNSDGVDNFHSFFTSFNRFEAYEASYWEQPLHTKFMFQVLPPTTVKKSYTEKTETVIPLAMSQYIQGNRVVVVFTVSASKIMDTLERSKADAATSFLITDQNDRVIAGDAGLHPSSGGSVNGRHLIITHVSEYGWIYYSATPASAYREQAAGVLWVTSWLSLILFIIGFVFSFLFSTKLYNPIRNLLDAQNKHERFSNELIESAFTSILSGNRLDKYDLFVQEIGFEQGEYLCCCIKFYFKETFAAEIQDTDRILILEKLKKVLSGILQQYVSAYVVYIQRAQYVVIVNLKEPGDRAKLDEALQSVMLTFSYDIKYCRVAIGIGRRYPHISGLSQSYGDARIALAPDDPQEDFQIIDAAKLPIKDHVQFSFADEDKIINSLKAGSMDLLESVIRSLVEKNLQNGISHPYMHVLMTELYSIGVKYSTEKGFNPFSMLQAGEHQILTGKSPQSLDFQEHLSLLLSFYREIISRVGSLEGRAEQPIARIIRYIDEHYAQDLYLERVAADMGLSAKYISRMFKEWIGTTITDYINIKRISEAKRMLETTDLKNDEIAARIGILSRATFFRLFRKYEGMTPQDYRKMRIKQSGQE